MSTNLLTIKIQDKLIVNLQSLPQPRHHYTLLYSYGKNWP